MRQLPAAVAVALGVAVSASSPAQTLAPSTTGMAVAAADSGIRGSRMIGMDVYNGQGEKVGTVEDVLIKSGAEPTAVLSVGGYLGTGGKFVAVPLNHVKVEASKVTMPTATREHLASMPVYLFPPNPNG